MRYISSINKDITLTDTEQFKLNASISERCWCVCSSFLKLCEWGVDTPSDWARPVGNSWRTTGDIGSPSWSNMLSNLDLNDQAWKAAGPAGWNGHLHTARFNRINISKDTLEHDLNILTHVPLSLYLSVCVSLSSCIGIDPDNLQVGNSINGQSLDLDEQIAQFSLWCIIKAPLLLGNDIRSMTQETLDILTNKEAVRSIVTGI